ncbi:MAG: hypothetical protein ACPL1K_00485, partial [Candidatus Kryptoniota bacterium]
MTYRDLHDEDETLFRPIYQTGRGFYLLAAVFSAILLTGIGLYVRQLVLGLGVTGMNEPVTWAFYIVDFVFFIGISHAGTLISAILRLSRAEWRRPITSPFHYPAFHHKYKAGCSDLFRQHKIVLSEDSNCMRKT